MSTWDRESARVGSLIDRTNTLRTPEASSQDLGSSWAFGTPAEDTSGVVTTAGSGEGSCPNACVDGVDNDEDGLVDCLDPDCFGVGCDGARVVRIARAGVAGLSATLDGDTITGRISAVVLGDVSLEVRVLDGWGGTSRTCAWSAERIRLVGGAEGYHADGTQRSTTSAEAPVVVRPVTTPGCEDLVADLFLRETFPGSQGVFRSYDAPNLQYQGEYYCSDDAFAGALMFAFIEQEWHGGRYKYYQVIWYLEWLEERFFFASIDPDRASFVLPRAPVF